MIPAIIPTMVGAPKIHMQAISIPKSQLFDSSLFPEFFVIPSVIPSATIHKRVRITPIVRKSVYISEPTVVIVAIKSLNVPPSELPLLNFFTVPFTSMPFFPLHLQML